MESSGAEANPNQPTEKPESMLGMQADSQQLQGDQGQSMEVDVPSHVTKNESMMVDSSGEKSDSSREEGHPGRTVAGPPDPEDGSSKGDRVSPVTNGQQQGTSNDIPRRNLEEGSEPGSGPDVGEPVNHEGSNSGNPGGFAAHPSENVRLVPKPPMGMAASRPTRELKVEDALQYLDQVRNYMNF